MTADDHISLRATSIHVFSVEITHECSSTTFTCLCFSLVALLEEKNLRLKIQ